MQIAVNIYKITLNHLKQLEPPGSNSRLRSLRASSVSSRGKWWSTAPDSGASWLIQLEMDIMGILMGYNIYIDYIYIYTLSISGDILFIKVGYEWDIYIYTIIYTYNGIMC
jgi:hypothetical protein